MPFIEFTSANAVSVPQVDEQHRMLFDILNELHVATMEGKEQSAMAAIFEKLLVYTIEHFELEEEFMKKMDYPGYEPHKKEHDHLTSQALDLHQRFNEGSATISFEFLDFLHDWLMGHTMGVDQQMGRFLRERL